jgi:hypothetical protein
LWIFCGNICFLLQVFSYDKDDQQWHKEGPSVTDNSDTEALLWAFTDTTLYSSHAGPSLLCLRVGTGVLSLEYELAEDRYIMFCSQCIPST